MAMKDIRRRLRAIKAFDDDREEDEDELKFGEDVEISSISISSVTMSASSPVSTSTSLVVPKDEEEVVSSNGWTSPAIAGPPLEPRNHMMEYSRRTNNDIV